MNHPRILRCAMYFVDHSLGFEKFYRPETKVNQKNDYRIISMTGVNKALQKRDSKSGKDLGNSCS